jgi:DNA polymerase III psi subunit
MNHPEIIESTFPEELYSISPKPVVAISTPWKSISITEKGLLEKILGAVKLSINHVEVVHTHQLDVLKWPNRPSHVLAFGLEMPGFSLYEPFDVQGIQVILSANLSALDQDKEGKQRLWAGLKKVFG